MLTIRDLSKGYGAELVLRGIDMELAPGEVLGLLGRNGAGKTTLLSTIAGLLQPDSGMVDFDDGSGRSLHESLGFVPQDLAIYPTLTVRANLRFFAELRLISRRTIRAEIDRLGQRLLLGDLMERKVSELSGGQKRRLHAAIGLLGEPRVVLLDEPTVGADATTRSQILEAVREFASEDGCSFIYTSHYTPEIEAVADRVAVLHHGVLAADGSLAAFVAREGRSELRLTFDRPVRCCYWGNDLRSEARIESDQPSETLAKVLADLDEDASALSGVDVVRPSLESAYLSLTEEVDA